jgi:hypothetical protein
MNIDNIEKLVTLEGAIKHRQSRETGYIGRGNQMDVVSAYLLRFGITINPMKFV